MGRPRAQPSWEPLEAARDASDRFGHKAARLAGLRAEGLPVLDGRVLAAASALHLGEDDALELARTLCDDPPGRWILRSSSPREDAALGSAAGLLHSGHADAVPEDVAEQILRVARSGLHPRVRELVGGGEGAVAVLAQPHVDFDHWATLECRDHDTGARVELDGWSIGTDGATRTHVAGFEAGEDPEDPAWRGVVELARRAHATTDTPATLLEIGRAAADGRHWLLQLRHAPVRGPRPPAPTDDEAPTELPSLRGLGLEVHPGDADHEWVWDAAHCPTPLCPLLAGLFGRWIASDPEASPSRLLRGYWHDRRDRERSGTSAPDPATIRHDLDEWERREREELEPALEELEERTDEPWPEPQAATRWRDFVAAWLDFQSAYYAGPSSRLRRWAESVDRRRRNEGLAPPSLPRTVAGERDRRWRALAGELSRHPDAPPPSAQGVAGWRDAHEGEDLAHRLDAEHRRCAHLCTWAFDGRGIPWEFDPWPFYAQIARRMHRSRGDDHDRRSGSARDARPHGTHGTADENPDEEARLAAAALARAEDDDDLLLRAYHLWHRALRRAVRGRGGTGADAEAALDLLPEDLERWLDGASDEERDRALTRGRALASAWAATTPSRAGDTVQLRGSAAAPGRVEGPVRRALHLASIEPGRGEPVIAVVSTLSPADAVHVPDLLGLVCEGGSVLGHASVLAREHGIPCVVGVPDARRRLARAHRILVDGDRGEIVVLDGDDPTDG